MNNYQIQINKAEKNLNLVKTNNFILKTNFCTKNSCVNNCISQCITNNMPLIKSCVPNCKFNCMISRY